MSKKYDNEFKKQTVQMMNENGKSVGQVAQELGISNKTLYGWVAAYKRSGKQIFPGRGELKLVDQEVRDDQKQIRDLREENEILKKAMHYFAKDRR